MNMRLNKFLKNIGLILAGVSLLGALAGCGGKDSNTITKDGKQIIRVGYFPNMTHAQALVGLSDGSFKNALGNKVELEEHTFNAGPSEIEALLAGEIDLGYIGPGPAINGYVKSHKGLQIIAGASDEGAVLVARKGSNIKSAKDLNGKKVAVPQLGNTQDITLRGLLKSAGLKDASKGGSVTIVPAENPDILTLIGKGEVDAALVPEPWGSRLVKQAGASVVLDADKVWPNGTYSTAVVIVSSHFLKEHPDLVDKWLKAHVDLTEKINKDGTNSKKIINEQIKKLTQKSLSQDVLDNSFKRIVVTNNPEVNSVKEFVKLSVDNGYLKEQPDISGLFNLEPLNKVLKEKGLAPITD